MSIINDMIKHTCLGYYLQYRTVQDAQNGRDDMKQFKHNISNMNI